MDLGVLNDRKSEDAVNLHNATVARGILRGVQAVLEELQDYLTVHDASQETQRALKSIHEAVKLVGECITRETTYHDH